MVSTCRGTDTLIRKLWKRANGWLQRAPIDDPVDRRNAPFVQGLLIFFVFFVLLNKTLYLWAVLSGRWHGRSALVLDLATDVAMCVAAGTALWMIRRGQFRSAVSLFLGTMLAFLLIIYAMVDVKSVSVEVFPLMVLALGGLVLGRRALWRIATVQVLGYGICLTSNLLGFVPEKEPVLVATGIIIATTGAYLLIAVIVDRTVSALRESLAEAITRTKELEHEMAERERAQRQLIHAQKMEVVGRVASGVAHDFDNVLSIVLGYAMRRKQLASQGEGALVEALEGVELAARRAMGISRQLLNFSRQDVAKAEVFDVSQALRELLPMLRQLFDASTRIEAHLEENELWVCMDQTHFDLTVLNVTSNARDAMPNGGRFSLRALREATTVVLELTDTGAGMASSVRQRIFEPFYTTKPLGSGTGLGLAIARDMLQAVGGWISVTTEPGQGTTLSLHLPAAQRP